MFLFTRTGSSYFKRDFETAAIVFFVNMNSSKIQTGLCEDSAVRDFLRCPGNDVQQAFTRGKSVSFCRNYVFVPNFEAYRSGNGSEQFKGAHTQNIPVINRTFDIALF